MLVNAVEEAKKMRGAALVTSILSILAILFVAALAVDSVVVFSIKEQLQNKCRLAALAAIKGYYQSEEADLKHTVRLESALNAAKAVLDENDILKIGDGGKEFELGGNENEIVSGVFKYIAPGVDPASAINAGGCGDKEGDYPRCFKSYDSLAEAEKLVNAILIRGELHSPVSGPFGGILKQKVSVPVTCIGTLEPTLVTFLIDRSRSTTFQSHPMEAGGTPPDDYWAAGFAYRAPYIDASPAEEDEWTALVAKGDRGLDGLPTFPLRHYHNDYSEVIIPADAAFSTFLGSYDVLHANPGAATTDNVIPSERYSTTRVAGSIAVDGYTLQDSEMGGPQPLSDILEGFTASLELYKESLRYGNYVSLIGFGEDLQWPTVVYPHTNSEYLLTFGNLQNLNSRPITHALFPFWDDRTHHGFAIREAAYHLTRVGELNLRHKIVLITDGISTCDERVVNSTDNLYDPVLKNYLPSQCLADDTVGCKKYGEVTPSYSTRNRYRCGVEFRNYYSAMSDLSGVIDKLIVSPKRSSIYTILVGPSAAIRNISGDGANGCIGADEAKEEGIVPVPFETSIYDVRQAYYENRDSGAPFYEPGRKWYDWSVSTGGTLVPIRRHDPACNDSCTGNANSDPTANLISCSRSTVSKQVEEALTDVFQERSYRIAPIYQN